MLTGFYKSSNPNLHDFRRPDGKITSDYLIKNQSGMNSVSRRQSHQLFRPQSNFSSGMNSVQNIIKPANFNTLKGHTIDKDRAIQS